METELSLSVTERHSITARQPFALSFIMQSLLPAVVAACALVTSVQGFAVNVDAHEKECFFDDVKAGTKMGMTFQVADGGFLDIDVSVSLDLFIALIAQQNSVWQSSSSPTC